MRLKKNKVIIVCDGSQIYGFGHIKRCKSLELTLKKNGFITYLIILSELENDNFTNGLWTGDKYKVHATGLIRNALQTSYCIGDKDNLDGEDWLHIGLHAEKKKGSPLMSAYYDAYYPKKFSNIDALNKKQLEAIGKSLMKVFKNNVQGKPGDYTMATQLLNFY